MKKIIIHCSDTTNGRHHTAEDIHRWHTRFPFYWSGIGYHYVIQVDGTQETGRPEYWTGAHAFGHNRGSIGICLIGTNKYSPEQWQILKNLILKLKIKYPGIEVIGHNEISNKSCPGFDVQEWLRNE